jgi:integrase
MAKKQRFGVKKRGDKWTACPWIPGQNRHAWSGTFDTEQEATEAALAKIEELRRLPAHLETVTSFAARWNRDFPREKDSTNDAYDRAAKKFAEREDSEGKRKLNEYGVDEAVRYAGKHPYDAPKLSVMFEDARRSRLILPGSNPFSKLGVSKGRGRKDIVPITEEELETLADLALAAHGEKFGPVFRSIIIFAAYTTIRPGELFGLDRADIDLANEKARIERQYHKRRIQLPKSNKTRELPFIPPLAVQAIRDLPRRVPAPICQITGGEILFPGKLDQRITQSSLSGYWQPVKTAFEAGLSPGRRAEFRAVRNPKDPTMDFYELRHFGATVMAERGVEPWVAAVMMGHEDGGDLFKKTYSHPRNEVARERLRRAFSEPTPLRAVKTEEATG